MENKTVWCILHQNMVLLEESKLCMGHVFNVLIINGWEETEFHCMTPFDYAFVAPPEFDMDTWLESVWEEELSDEELREIKAQEIQDDYEWLTN